MKTNSRVSAPLYLCVSSQTSPETLFALDACSTLSAKCFPRHENKYNRVLKSAQSLWPPPSQLYDVAAKGWNRIEHLRWFECFTSDWIYVRSSSYEALASHKAHKLYIIYARKLYAVTNIDLMWLNDDEGVKFLAPPAKRQPHFHFLFGWVKNILMNFWACGCGWFK